MQKQNLSDIVTDVVHPKLRTRGVTYIGPNSDWENPYRTDATSDHYKVDSDQEANEKYVERIQTLIGEKVITLETLAALHGKTLGSYMANRPECHGRTLAKLALQANEVLASDGNWARLNDTIRNQLTTVTKDGDGNEVTISNGGIFHLVVTGTWKLAGDQEHLAQCWMLLNHVRNLVEELEGTLVIVHGDDNGPDIWAREFAEQMGVMTQPHESPTSDDWDEIGKRAGYLYQERMWSQANAGIIFWDGQAKTTGIPFELCGKLHIPAFLVMDDRLMDSNNAKLEDGLEDGEDPIIDTTGFDDLEIPDAKSLIVRKDGANMAQAAQAKVSGLESMLSL